MSRTHELRTPLRRFSTKLPWQDLMDPDRGILTTKDGGLLCAYVLDPTDLGSLAASERAAVMQGLNRAWMLLDGTWATWEDCLRVPVTEYPEAAWRHPLAALLDDEWRARLTAPGARFAIIPTLFLWQKPEARLQGLFSWLYTQTGEARYAQAEALVEAYEARVAHVAAMLATVSERVVRLDAPALLGYLHDLISVFPHPVDVPDPALDVSAYLAAECGLEAGIRPRLVTFDGEESQYIRCVTLNYEFPHQTRSLMFQQLYRLPFPYRWSTRWIPMARQAAKKTTDKVQVNWMSLQTNWRQWLYEKRSGVRVEGMDRHPKRQAEDADIVRDLMLSGKEHLGHLTTTFVVQHHDLQEANRRLREIATVVRHAGCNAVDDPLNQREAYFGTLPGNVHANLDRPPVTTLNLANLGCVGHLPWRGVTWNTHLDGPPLCQTVTEGCMPFGLDLHVGDNGLAIQVGPLGSGKSSQNNWLALQALRYDGMQVSLWDILGSARCTTLCVDGDYCDLGAGDLQVQVLAYLDDDAQLPYIYQWLVNRVKEAGMAWEPDIGTYLMGGLTAMRRKPEIPRTLYDYLNVLTAHSNTFAALGSVQQHRRAEQLSLMAPKVREALRPYARGGIFGHLMDAPQDRLRFGRWITFELDRLLKLDAVYPAVLEVIFYREKQRIDGQPMHRQFNEAWHYFRHPVFLKLLADELPNWRKQNISGIFSTQSISQLLGNPLTPLLLESCPTRLFLPNAQALDDHVRDAYEGLGLHAEEIRRNIAQAVPKREVYVARPDGRRLVDLRLEPLAAAICGANRPEDHRRMDDVLARHGPERFAVRWLASCGFADAARRLDAAFDHLGDPHAAVASVVAAD